MVDLTVVSGMKPEDIPYDKLPPNLRNGIVLYIEEHIPTGGFLRAVLENDLYAAIRRADLDSRCELYDLCMWLQWNAPKACFGSKQAVAEWLAPTPPQESAA